MTNNQIIDLPSAPPIRPPIDLDKSLRRTIYCGIAVIILFFVGILGWGASADLASAAIAPATVTTLEGVQQVRHETGGRVLNINVLQGAHFTKDTVLMVIDNPDANTRFEQSRSLFVSTFARKTRLEAERDGLDEVTFPRQLLEDDNDATREVIENERKVFSQRRETRESSRNILGQRIDQMSEQINGQEEIIRSRRTEKSLINQEITGVQELLDLGLARRPRLLELQRQRTRLEGDIARSQAEIARIREQVNELELQIINLDVDFQRQVSIDLADRTNELSQISEDLVNASEAINRTEIIAPFDGTVSALYYGLEGAVIPPQEVIMELVPDVMDLLIEARVSPNDIDNVEVGQEARVILSAYRQRNLPRIMGEVVTVIPSAVQPRNGGQYFPVYVMVPAETLANIYATEDGRSIRLQRDMQAQVMITTGERTMLEYILEPFFQSMNMSFRES